MNNIRVILTFFTLTRCSQCSVTRRNEGVAEEALITLWLQATINNYWVNDQSGCYVEFYSPGSQLRSEMCQRSYQSLFMGEQGQCFSVIFSPSVKYSCSYRCGNYVGGNWTTVVAYCVPFFFGWGGGGVNINMYMQVQIKGIVGHFG